MKICAYLRFMKLRATSHKPRETSDEFTLFFSCTSCRRNIYCRQGPQVLLFAERRPERNLYTQYTFLDVILEGIPILKTPSVKQLLIIILPAIAILSTMVAVSVFYNVPMHKLTCDISCIADIHPFSGVLSNLGILLWCVAASTCAFAAMTIRSAGDRKNYLFLLFSALLSAYLLFDDFFMFHEVMARWCFGLNEKVIFVLLGIAVFIYIVSFRKVILQTNFIILLLAVAFLSLSVIVDAIFEPWLSRLGDWEYLIEDGAKWLGIVFWCSYYIDSSFQFVKENYSRT